MRRDGGPAYPTESAHPTGQHSWHFEGMTLRDYFAGQVLTGGGFADMTTSQIALVCYDMADAMIAERERDR